MMKFPAGKRAIFRFISQLNIHYHESEAVRESLTPQATLHFRRTLPAGRRVPNGKIDGSKSLFDLIGGYRFHVLVFTRRVTSDQEREKLRSAWQSSVQFDFKDHWFSLDPENSELFQRFGVDEEAAFAIRPDGYVMTRTDSPPLLFANWSL